MSNKERKLVEASEIAYLANIWKNASYNFIGNNLRLKRELNSLLFLSNSKYFYNVLSIGCGDGDFEFILSKYAENITAIDISPEAIQSANLKKQEKNIKNINFVCSSFAEIEFNKKFDLIICLSFLHHVRESDMQNSLIWIYDHLEYGGFFYSQDPNVNGILRKIGRVILGNKYDCYHTPDERELDPAQITKQLSEIGFRSIKINYIDFTLIPLLYMFTRKYEWLMYLGMLIDLICSKLPFAKYSSGYSLIGKKLLVSLFLHAYLLMIVQITG